MMTAMAPSPIEPLAADAFAAQRGYLWAVAYRMLGSAADADDALQDTFVRALERPPARLDEPLGPWLTRVLVNVARDRLRARKRRAYVGPWLPSPIENEAPPDDLPGPAELSPGARYDLRESASFAFLFALEALTPNQRAVLLMRDVLDASLEETAEVLGLSVANVKVQHHRARKRLESYERSRVKTASAAAQEVLARFMTCLATDDVAGLEELLAGDVRLLSDGGGEFHAARVPVVGVAKVITFLRNVLRLWPIDTRYEIRWVNGAPAILGEAERARAGEPTRFVTRLELDAGGRVREIHTILATAKLTAFYRTPPTEG